MTFCKTTHDLNNNMDNLDDQDLIEQQIEYRAEALFSKLKRGLFILRDGKGFHIEHVISCVDIDPYLLTECVSGNSQNLTDFLTEKVYNTCYDIAKSEIASDNL